LDSNNNILLKAQNLQKDFMIGRETLHVLRGCSLQVRQGEFLAIMGASGSGKSTLLHIMGLLDKPDSGQVHFDGQDLFALPGRRQDSLRNREIGFVFQFYHLLPELTLAENIMLPGMVGSSIFNWPRNKQRIREKTQELLKAINLEDRAGQWPNTLSGGERQRTAIARALVMNPRILLADEPTGNLDSEAGMAILDLLSKLNRNGQTIVMVTHDQAIADLAHRRLRLKDGRLEKID
jgi:ABC-type lipoprotein export system ATPase subunit